MSEINPALVPTISPGNIFNRFTDSDSTLNIRWLEPSDPVLFEALNRPIGDVVVRQLIIAKALDAIQLELGHLALFPFLVPPRLLTGTGEVELPVAWMWDFHASLPAKWEHLRLAKIKRVSGSNTAGASANDITGTLRLVFTAQQEGSGIEVSLFTVDYKIDSNLSYQVTRIVAATDEETNPIDAAEVDTINGFVIFRTLSTEDETNIAFYEQAAPPSSSPVLPNGEFTTPASYEMASTPEGGSGVPDDFLAASLSHGSGVLVASAWNAIPSLDSDFASWIKAANYPFRIGATRRSNDGIEIPEALFNEFSLVVPASDEPTGDTTNNNSPVWLSSIERVDDLATQLRFVFSTNSIDDAGNNNAVEFAALTLARSNDSGRVVQIQPADDLLKQTGTDQTNFRQGFGLGHVVLGSIWGSTTDTISDFFDSFLSLISSSETAFTEDAGRLSSFSLARSSRYVPTKGQWEALRGSTGRLTTPNNPSDSNRYITEGDQGLGDTVDFRTITGISEHPQIDPFGYTGSLAHRSIKLVIDTADESDLDYDRDVLPRLRCLLGRDPIFGDMWFDGTLWKIHTGDAWLSI